MKRRDFVLSTLSSPLLLSGWAAQAQSDTRAAALSALRQAAVYMDEVVSYRGGYVWSYAPDLSQHFGEMEANRTMCWIQPRHAVRGPRLSRRLSRHRRRALLPGRRPHRPWRCRRGAAPDRAAGTTSTTSRARARSSDWYDTIGANGWRLEEFQHYYGNATFDDAEHRRRRATDAAHVPGEDRTRASAGPRPRRSTSSQDAQFGRDVGIADGGWPQRFPHSTATRSSPCRCRTPSWLPAGLAGRHGGRRLHAACHLQRRRAWARTSSSC